MKQLKYAGWIFIGIVTLSNMQKNMSKHIYKRVQSLFPDPYPKTSQVISISPAVRRVSLRASWPAYLSSLDFLRTVEVVSLRLDAIPVILLASQNRETTDGVLVATAGWSAACAESAANASLADGGAAVAIDRRRDRASGRRSC